MIKITQFEQEIVTFGSMKLAVPYTGEGFRDLIFVLVGDSKVLEFRPNRTYPRVLSKGDLAEDWPNRVLTPTRVKIEMELG